MDTSFEEYVNGNRNVLALVVSDNEDDYDSSMDSVSISTELNGSSTNLDRQDTIQDQSSPVPKQELVVPRQRANEKGEKGTKSGGSKRWSFISNHSSSSKKRWSTLSSIPSESASRVLSGTKDPIKRLSSASNFSVDSMGFDAVSRRQTSSDKNSVPSLKRSSTGLSLRQLFNKIVVAEDDTLSQGGDKENTGNKKETASLRNSASSRYPLRTLTNENASGLYQAQSRTTYSNTTRHSVHFNPTGPETSNTSRLSKSSSITSLSSKLKFWKRAPGVPKSESKRNLNISEPLELGNSDSNIRTKTSYSDLHKSIYSSYHYSKTFLSEPLESGMPMRELQQKKSRTSILNKKKSGSSLSVNTGLKHFSSTSSLSLGGLKNKSSHSSINMNVSMKHKSSHSSLHKLAKHRRKSNNGDDRSSISSTTASTISANYQISLPVPDQVSREKIRNKLKNSTSLLSLNSSIPVFKKEFDESLLQELLDYCNCKYVIKRLNSLADDDVPIFHTFNNANQISKNIWRISGPFNWTKEKSIIFRRIELGSVDDITYSKKAIALHELKAHNYTSQMAGITKVLRSYVVTSDIASPGDNIDTDDLKNLYLIMVMKDHGSSLAKLTPINDWKTSVNIFWNTVSILAGLEQRLQFEHRNLLLDHILVDERNGSITISNLNSSRFQQDDMNTIAFTRLDDPLFFQRSARDDQYEVYSTMRMFLSENFNNQANGCPVWARFEPRTNLLWAHNLCKRLIQETTDSKHQSERDHLTRICSAIDPVMLSRRSMLKRNDGDIKSLMDILKWKKTF